MSVYVQIVRAQTSVGYSLNCNEEGSLIS